MGCGSATPTLRHSPSSQVVEVDGKYFMVDCGEGTQVQLRRVHINFNKIVGVFISHLHGDHFFGLIGMISSFGLLGRIAPLHVYADEALRDVLDMQISRFCQSLGYEVVFHAIDTTRQSVVYEDRGLLIETLPLRHRMPCCGFLFKEKEHLPHIKRDMIDFLGIPLSQINNIKNGIPWQDPQSMRVYTTEELTEKAPKGRQYAYCSDTKYLPDLAQRLKDVDLLYHEATYLSVDEKKADKYQHSTARQAALVAKHANAKRLIIGHFSNGVEDESLLLAEAREVFKYTDLCNELSVFEL